MTTDLQTRIAAIKAECEEILKLSEKATAGPWNIHPNYTDPQLTAVESGPKPFIACSTYIAHGEKIVCETQMYVGQEGGWPRVDNRDEMMGNTDFIAHARNVSPAMAKVVIAAIDMLSIQAEIGTGAGVRQHAINALDAIIAAWPEELL